MADRMIVTAVLAWWDEHPEDLDRCVRGVATIADRIIALDGAYSRYPGATVGSDIDQVDAILAAAHDVGLEADVQTPTRLWAGQVEKRAFLFNLVRWRAPETEWIAVVDADWVVSGNRDEARAELAGFGPDVDVVSVPFFTPPGPAEEASGWHRLQAGTTVQQAHLFRALPGLTVERHHWQYSAWKDGEPVWMWGGLDESRRILPIVPLEAPYLIEHRCFERTPAQVRAGRAFINDRLLVLEWTGQEDDRPELPRPVFDFETMPYAELA